MQTHQIRTFIMDAAESRFAQYGYSKTTMGEIASDCSMSVGNLYRHFENKSVIATACVERFHQVKLKSANKASQQQMSFLEKLESFLLTCLRVDHSRVVKHRHLYELATIVESKHVDSLISAEEELIQNIGIIVQEGIIKGQVKEGDANVFARLIYQSLRFCKNPLNLKKNSLKTLELDLHNTLDLFYTGLRR